jgi:hypothetical protein
MPIVPKIDIYYIKVTNEDYDFGNLRKDIPGIKKLSISKEKWTEYVLARRRYEELHAFLVRKVK